MPISSTFLFSYLILIFHEVNLCEKFFLDLDKKQLINFLKPENHIFLKKIAVVDRDKVMIIIKYYRVSHSVVS